MSNKSTQSAPWAWPPFINTAFGPISNNARPCSSICSIDVASFISKRIAASGMLGVNSAAKGSKRVRSASMASVCNKASPDLAIITGSRTIGLGQSIRAATTVPIMSDVASIPILTAPVFKSSNTASSWAAMMLVGILCTAVTAWVF